MNFTQINLDLQSTMKRIYASLLYRSSFMNFANPRFMEVARQETPIIEVIKPISSNVNTRTNVELTQNNSNIAKPLVPELANYDSVKVDLTELKMDYSFMVSPVVMGSGIAGAIDEQLNLKDSEIATKMDIYGYGKLAQDIVGSTDGKLAYTKGQIDVWAPSTGDEVIEELNHLKALLFDRNVYDGYLLGLKSTAYAYFVSKLTSVLKYETRAGVEGVDMGQVAEAYGIRTFQINSNVLSNGEVGYFANEIGLVADLFFSKFQLWNEYPGLPGYVVCEGNLFFGAKVVRSEAIIKLVDSKPELTEGTFDAGTHEVEYAQETPFSGTNVVKVIAEGLPDGLSINESTGAVTGTPTTEGSYDVKVYGLDVNGNYSDVKEGTIVIA